VARGLLAAALAAFIAAVCVSPAFGASGFATQPRIGIAGAGDLQTFPPQDRARYLDDVKDAGASWIRVDFYWCGIQGESPAGFDWRGFDGVVRAARRRGLSVLAVLLCTPSWARAPGAPPNAPPTDPAQFGAFAFQAARHLGARGVRAYEIWNEPNIADFWAPGPDPAGYTRLLKAAYRGIKHAEPRATVVSGGLSPFAGDGVSDAQHMNPVTFLAQMYENGARTSMDAVGWHPYNFPTGLSYHPWSAWSQMAQTTPSARSIMRANGDAKKKIWATEWGVPTGSSESSVSEVEQAQLVAAGLARLTAWRWAGPSFLYSLRDQGSNAADYEQNFGLVRNDWSQKPAFDAFRRAAAPRG
jgi:Cellulase (glycosyl hydrolase family 5)